MERGETPITLSSAHVANAEVYRRMAMHWGYAIDWQPMDAPFEVYAAAVFYKDCAAPAVPNPHGLRIVR